MVEGKKSGDELPKTGEPQQESRWGAVKDVARNIGIAVGIGVASIGGILLAAVIAIKTGLTDGPGKEPVPVTPKKDIKDKALPPKGKRLDNGQNVAPAAVGEIAVAGQTRETKVAALQEKGILPRDDAKGVGR